MAQEVSQVPLYTMRFIFFNFPVLLLKWVLTVLVFCTPILGFWLASSLVAYSNGPTSLAVFSGVLLFPLLPIAWELQANRSRQRHSRQKPRILTWGDRLILRALALNLAFIACLLALRPQTSFMALSTRGDWMLDNKQGVQAEVVRQALFRTANTLEWLYVAVRNNPYEQYAKDTGGKIPTLQPQLTSQPFLQDNPTQQDSRFWPWEGSTLHPAVANMPPDVEVSIESVARYIAQQEPDPYLRVKALHDYVVDRIAYDAPAYFGRSPRPPQDAQTVFQTRKAVCAGYAKLLEALGNAIGEEIVYVVGDSRSQISDLGGSSHAWNAAKIEGRWYLVDATWDSGYVDSSGFTKQYRADYLFPPPEVLIISHFPDDPAWQILPTPRERGEFLRQPMMQPEFFAEGLKLISPTRSQTDVRDTAIIQIDNPRQRWLMASFVKKGGQQLTNCAEQPSPATQISCPLPDVGTYEVNLFSSKQQYGQYAYVGQVEFNKQ